MSNRSRGLAFEKKIQEYLSGIGFTIDRARAAVKFIGPGRAISSPNDFFGCADLIGVHQQKPYTLFLQCTKGDTVSRRKKCEAVKWNLDAQKVQVWTDQSGIRNGIRSYKLCKDGEWSEHIWIMRPGVKPDADVL